MTKFLRYELVHFYFNGHCKPYNLNVPFYTQTKDKDAVVAEFREMAAASKSLCRMLADATYQNITGPEETDLSEICDDPVVFFRTKEEMMKTYAVPDNATRLLVYKEDVLAWNGSSPLELKVIREGKKRENMFRPVATMRMWDGGEKGK